MYRIDRWNDKTEKWVPYSVYFRKQDAERFANSTTGLRVVKTKQTPDANGYVLGPMFVDSDNTVRQNPVKYKKTTEIAKAAKLRVAFSNENIDEQHKINIPALPKVVAAVGWCDSVNYSANRNGTVEKYTHKFAKKDRPMLCSNPDGTQLLFVGGNYSFTPIGIVDHSDKANMRRAVEDYD